MPHIGHIGDGCGGGGGGRFARSRREGAVSCDGGGPIFSFVSFAFALLRQVSTCRFIIVSITSSEQIGHVTFKAASVLPPLL